MKLLRNTTIRSPFIFFTVAITIKFTFLRYQLLADTNPLYSIIYEMSFLLIFLAAIELLLNKGRTALYFLLDLILSLLFIGLLLYERYFDTIPTYYDLSQLNQVGSVNESMTMLLRPADFFYFADFLIFFIFMAVTKKAYPAGKLPKILSGGVLIAALLLSLVNFMLSKNDMMTDNALFAKENGYFTTQFVQYYQDQSENGITFADEQNEPITQETIEELKGNDYLPMEQHEYFGLAEGRDLIVIQIESLQSFILGTTIDGQEITPNLNRWMEESTYFPNFYQQIGAGNTSDAEYLLNTSLYPLGSQATSEQTGGLELPSLPRILADSGYYTTTMHADHIEYWDRNLLYKAFGFDEYVTREFYGEEDLIGFGPSDEVFYKKSAEALEAIAGEHDNFYANVLSLTSHTPFEMPEDKQGIELPPEYEGTLIGNYIQSVHYADKTLGQFFDDLKEKGLWDNSLIALYGDHSGVHGKLLKDIDRELITKLTGEPYNLRARFNVPFIIGLPGDTNTLPDEVDTLGGQIDMMPTILNLLGEAPDSLYFGHNLLHYESNLLGMRYYLPTGSFFHDNIFYIAENSRYSPRVIDIKSNGRIESSMEDPAETFKQQREDVIKLMKWSDAYFESLD